MYGASGASRARWWRLQPGVDALDFAVIVAEWRRGAVSGPAAGLMAGHGAARDGARGGLPPEPRLASASTAGSDGAAPIWLGHGASGGPETMKPYMDALDRRGLKATRCASRAARRRGRCSRCASRWATARRGSVIGGHSFGGRVASLVAAQTRAGGSRPAQLPAAPPGPSRGAAGGALAPDQLPGARALGRPRPVRAYRFCARAVTTLPQGRLHIYPGLRHGLTARRGRRGGAHRASCARRGLTPARAEHPLAALAAPEASAEQRGPRAGGRAEPAPPPPRSSTARTP